MEIKIQNNEFKPIELEENNQNEQNEQYKNKCIVMIYFIWIFILSIYDSIINIFTLQSYKYEEPTLIVDINCNNTYLVSLITGYCPNHYDNCNFTNYWKGIQIIPIISDFINIIAIVYCFCLLYENYKNKSNRLKHDIIGTFICSLISVIISTCFYLNSPILLKDDNLCGNVNTKCMISDVYCNEIYKYCDYNTYSKCFSNDFITFNYKNTNVIEMFRNKMNIFRYFYYPMFLIIPFNICYFVYLEKIIK